MPLQSPLAATNLSATLGVYEKEKDRNGDSTYNMEGNNDTGVSHHNTDYLLVATLSYILLPATLAVVRYIITPYSTRNKILKSQRHIVYNGFPIEKNSKYMNWGHWHWSEITDTLTSHIVKVAHNNFCMASPWNLQGL